MPAGPHLPLVPPPSPAVVEPGVEICPHGYSVPTAEGRGQPSHFLPQSVCLKWVGPRPRLGSEVTRERLLVGELAGLPHPRRGLTVSVLLPPPTPTPEDGGPGPGVAGMASPPWVPAGGALCACLCPHLVRTPVAGIRATSFQPSPLQRPRLQGRSHPEGLGSGLKTGMWGDHRRHRRALPGFALRSAPASSAVPERCLQLPPPRRRARGRCCTKQPRKHEGLFKTKETARPEAR